MTTVYITKYWTTTGIVEGTADPSVLSRNPKYCWVSRGMGSQSHYRIGSDVFFDRDEAVAWCEKNRIKKIESLRKQIAKIEGIKL